jgi:hypothetical protein
MDRWLCGSSRVSALAHTELIKSKEFFMKNSIAILVTAVMAVSMWLPLSAQAEVLFNDWTPVDDIVPGAPECSGDEEFRVEGMAHTKVATLRNGNLAIHTNAMGTVTRLEPEEELGMFRQNVRNVYPVMGEKEVYSYGDSVRVITEGGVPNVRVNIRFHVTEIDGDLKSYIDVRDVSCE